ncbi:MAG TPA: MFS transporter, partial [Acidimicrobiales bacterium]|nr:MFS transporter [Acidimicrobiales bacterium]
MTQVVSRAVVDAGALDDVLAARDGLIAERGLGDGQFEATEGPVDDYRRVVTIERLPDGRSSVTQTVSYRLRIPFFAPVFLPGYRRWLGRIGPLPKTVWWAPPVRLGVPQWSVLTRLAGLAMVTGYLSTLLTQTMTFSAQEFGVDKTAQGVALAVVRADVVLAIALVALADRRGRRTVAIWAAVAGSALTAAGALSPSLPWLVASQLVARGFVTGVTITAAVMAAEAMPAGSRAWSVGVLAMASALGVGVCVVLLPIAGAATPAWRALYALGLVGVPLALVIGRRLPESHRFLVSEAAHTAHPAHPAQTAEAVEATPARTDRPRRFRRRLALLAGGAFLFNVFSVPASQFQNEYLR